MQVTSTRNTQEVSFLDQIKKNSQFLDEKIDEVSPNSKLVSKHEHSTYNTYLQKAEKNFLEQKNRWQHPVNQELTPQQKANLTYALKLAGVNAYILVIRQMEIDPTITYAYAIWVLKQGCKAGVAYNSIVYKLLLDLWEASKLLPEAEAIQQEETPFDAVEVAFYVDDYLEQYIVHEALAEVEPPQREGEVKKLMHNLVSKGYSVRQARAIMRQVPYQEIHKTLYTANLDHLNGKGSVYTLSLKIFNFMYRVKFE